MNAPCAVFLLLTRLTGAVAGWRRIDFLVSLIRPTRDLLRLTDVQSRDLAARRNLKPKIRSEISPLLPVNLSGQVQPMVVHMFDRCKSLVTQCFLIEFLEASRISVLIKLGVRLKQ
jgi:hypothetical protein